MEIGRLIWDPWNVQHIARHRVVPREVEEVCHSFHVVRGARFGRLMVIGRTNAGRVLAIVLEAEEEHVYYPVTARSADRKERRILKAEGGEA